MTVTGNVSSPSFDAQRDLVVNPSDSEFRNLFASTGPCGRPIKGPDITLGGPVAVAILIALSSAAIELWQAKWKEEFDRRQKMAGRDSGAKVVMTAEQARSADCIVFARWAAGDSEADPGLIVVLKVERPAVKRSVKDALNNVEAKAPDHFTARPVFVRARNSISETKKGEPITLVVAVALQQIVNVQGVPALVDIGASTTRVRNVKLSDEVLCVPKEGKPPCAKSTIHPLPNDDGTVVVGIGIQEVGDLGFEVDMAKAEIDAIAAALGPLSGQLIKGHYDREKVRESR
ncbi:hypothetical protein RAS12_30985 (plasmid) [Achromobacter seleniivolatilans]|uniref:Peptidase A2 domain-containing protein n=1 Tax=Achromobacter seleniivolatilans TaxID=3047478 RepID=A0ABY9MBF1_9BURK|nr:hypothetical protein [Achromobacter sp. R39]WMD24060.1 hypothetical protein RAS12_30985 [Achromobacter sp. R39]